MKLDHNWVYFACMSLYYKHGYIRSRRQLVVALPGQHLGKRLLQSCLVWKNTYVKCTITMFTRIKYVAGQESALLSAPGALNKKLPSKK